MRLGDLYLQREPARALQLYDEVLATFSDASQEPRLMYHRGLALYGLGRSADALAVFHALDALRPPPEIRSFGRFYLGELYRELGRQEESRRWYDQALRSDPPQALREAIEQRLQSPQK